MKPLHWMACENGPAGGASLGETIADFMMTASFLVIIFGIEYRLRSPLLFASRRRQRPMRVWPVIAPSPRVVRVAADSEIALSFVHCGLLMRGYDEDAGFVEEVKTLRGDLARIPGNKRSLFQEAIGNSLPM